MLMLVVVFYLLVKFPIERGIIYLSNDLFITIGIESNYLFCNENLTIIKIQFGKRNFAYKLI
jgi:hypothetical protein